LFASVTFPYNATGTQELQGERDGGVMLSSAARRPWEIFIESAKERSASGRKARIGGRTVQETKLAREVVDETRW
jgi:hypothetical protein